MRSIVQMEDKCFICGRAFGSETHHIFGAANRRWSEADGLTIRVCRSCHESIHEGPNTKSLMKALHQIGQEKWEAYYGPGLKATGKDVTEEFVKRYGRNYL